MQPFTFSTSKTVHFGVGKLNSLGEIAKSIAGKNLLIITDPGMLETGIIQRATNILEQSGATVSVFSDVQADPPEKTVLSATKIALEEKAEGIIGIGGGSSLDVSKLVSLLAKGKETLSEIYGIGNAKGPRLPLILVPTTAGTGSEVTPISIVTTGENQKMGVVSPVILPDIALLDPELTLGLPPHITAATGIDAMVHAIESYASANPNNNPISRQLAVYSLQLMAPALLTAVHDGQNLKARSDMLLGSMLAGQAFANSPVAAVHALAYPLGGHFHIPHGLSNALVLPHVLRFNAETSPDAYSELAPYLFPELAQIPTTERAESFCNKLTALSKACGLPQTLRDMNIPQDILPTLAQDAMKQQRLLVNNPREVTESDALAIYSAAY